MIKYFPLKTISANTLKMHVERVQTLGTKIDLIIVDYADILRSENGSRGSNSYTDAGNIYEELRAVAGELQMPCWSASQCGRASTGSEIIDVSGIADSYRKIMTSDVVITVQRLLKDKRKMLRRDSQV